jgi:hypothetical protein
VTPTELETLLREQGVNLSLRLVLKGPRSVLTSDVVNALAALKTDLLVHLAREAQWAELAPRRWGPAVGDPEPGIVVDR